MYIYEFSRGEDFEGTTTCQMLLFKYKTNAVKRMLKDINARISENPKIQHGNMYDKYINVPSRHRGKEPDWNSMQKKVTRKDLTDYGSKGASYHLHCGCDNYCWSVSRMKFEDDK